MIALSLEKTQAARRKAEERGAELAVALETINRQQRMADAILDTVDVGLVLLDGDGVYREVNRRHREFMALSHPEGHSGRAGDAGLIYGEDGTTPVPAHDLPSQLASSGAEFEDRRVWFGDDPVTRRALSVSARPVLDDQGRFVGAALAYKDVTDYMRAIEVKDAFVASVSHELRTPLTSIMGYVDLLLERGDLPADVLRHLAVIERNSDRLLQLVANLLHTALTDDGRTAAVRGRIDLCSIVRNSVEAAAPAARTARVTLEADAPVLMWVSVDGQGIAQVLDNLVSNAIKYTPAGGRVDVRLTANAERIELTVTDTGIGIDEAERERLFTRFFRTHDAGARSIQGVGLGLSIVKEIVESHAGTIDVESTAGVGSVFRVTLPITALSPAAQTA